MSALTLADYYTDQTQVWLAALTVFGALLTATAGGIWWTLARVIRPLQTRVNELDVAVAYLLERQVAKRESQ